MHPDDENKNTSIQLLFSILIIFGCIGITQAQQLADSTLRSFHHVGDTLQMLPNEDGYDSHILAFADVSTCFTCDQMLHNFSILAKQYHLSITLIMEGQMQDYADSQKKRSEWPFAVIGDPLHLYEKEYEVIAPPFYFLTDHEGKILALDKLAGLRVSMNELQALIADAGKRRTFGQSSLPIIKEFPLTDSAGSPLVIGGQYRVIPFVHSSMIVVLDASLHFLYIADSAGREHRKLDLRYAFGTPTRISWFIPDKKLLVRLASSTYNCMLYTLDISSGKVAKIQYDKDSIPQGCYMPDAWGNPLTGLIYGDLLPVQSRVALDTNQPTIIVFDSIGHFLRMFGKPDKTLTKYLVSGIVESYLGFDNHGWLYEFESPSDAVNVYSPDGNLIQHIPMKFGSKWKPYTTNLPENEDMSFWIQLNTSCSWERNILLIPGDTQGCVVYFNAKYKSGTSDPHSSDVMLTYFIHGLNSDFSQGDDVELPVNNEPIAVNKNYCLSTQYQGNHLNLIWYRLKN